LPRNTGGGGGGLGALPPLAGTPGSPMNVAPTTSEFRLPTKHSRKCLPTIITDYEELLTSAEAILAANEGSLFTYNPTYAKLDYTVENDRDTAWAAADTTVQTVEAILRGFCWHIPGTCWHRYVPPSTNKDGPNSMMTNVPTEDIPMAMEELIDRLYKEGLAYMKLRAERLEELHKASGRASHEDDLIAGLLAEPSPPEDDNEDNQFSFLTSGGSGGGDDAGDGSSSDLARLEGDNNMVETTPDERKPYLHDFALPGPTTAMYDCLLDVAAVTGDVNCADKINVWHELAFTRHQLDGGCRTNRNIYTVPTALTFNALIRYAVSVPVRDGDLELRDTALAWAFSTYQTLDEVEIVHKNAASVNYLLQVIAKYMPPSRIRGNIAAGVFHQARYRGLVNSAVVDAYIAANTPSNCPEDDAYIRDTLRGPQPIPPKWKRDSKKYRYNPREDFY
jgi:hypothetical protein